MMEELPNRMPITRFNIRVYGIVIDDNKASVLLCTEQYKGKVFTKFPGGGLEYGEGIADCLRREFIEELNTEITFMEHFYTTDFFQQSAFAPTDQIISVYFKVKTSNYIESHETIHDGNSLKFFRKPLASLTVEDVTFPIDRLVVNKIREILL